MSPRMRRPLIVVVLTLVPSILLVCLVLVYHQRSQKTSVLSSLLVLRQQVLAYGSSHGCFPNRFDDLEAGRVLPKEALANVVFCAAGTPYNSTDIRLFEDGQVRKFLWEEGRFIINSYTWSFVRGPYLGKQGQGTQNQSSSTEQEGGAGVPGVTGQRPAPPSKSQ